MQFRTGFDTTSGSMQPVNKIVTAIQQAFIRDRVQLNNLGIRKEAEIQPVYLTGNHESEANVPLFYHSIVVDYKGEQFLVSDLRSYLNNQDTSRPPNERIRNLSEFNFAKSKSILNLLWLNPMRLAQLRNNFQFAAMVFANWIAELVGKSYSLNPADKQKVIIIASFYYQSLFFDEVDEARKANMATHTMKTAVADATTVFSVFDKLKPMPNIEALVETLRQELPIQLGRLSTTVLFQMSGSSWFAQNAAFLISAAFEHPPTWIAIVAAAFGDKSYKNTLINRVCETMARRGNASEFIHNFTDLMKEMSDAN